MYRNFILTILTILTFFSLKAQQTVFEEARTVYSTENTFAVVLHTQGWGANYRMGKYTDGFNLRVWEFELVGMKDPKQIKIFNPFLDDNKGYFYGKLNSFTIFRPSIGWHRNFISKQSVRGVAISSVTHIGASIGYTKPVYLTVIKDFDEFGQPRLAVERYDPNLHDVGNIYGKASGLKGLTKGRFYPGIFAKAGLNFEYSRDAARVSALEIGAALDVYAEKIPIMALTENHQIFLTLYLNLIFGGRKTN